MKIKLQRRYFFPTLAVLLVLGLALWQWLEPRGAAHAPMAPVRGVNSVDWTSSTLTLTGRTDASSKAVLVAGDTETPAVVDDHGDFVVTIKLEQKSPSRLTLKLGDDTYGLLLLRLQGHWAALQRAISGPSASPSTARGWLPSAGFNDEPVSAGILTITQDSAGYAAVMATPPEHTTYVYGNNRLTGVIKQGADAAPIVSTLPNDSSQMRLDIYDSADHLAQRLRLTMPPGDSTAHYNLNDGELWILTDYSAQKAEVDEVFPGQFIPVSNDEAAKSSPAADAASQGKGATPAQNAEAR